MKVLIAADSFKGSLTSEQVAELIKKGILLVYPDADIQCVAIADGGEGTVDAVVSAMKGRNCSVKVTGPAGDTVDAKYGIVGGDTAVIEMAESTGLALIPPGKRNPMLTTSFGFGEQIKDALDRGVRRIILGIGGSATNDGGAGMAKALGARFTDTNGNDVESNGGALGRIAKIDMSGFDHRIKDVEIVVASDVTNPLCGEKGASRVYGPQKGATPEMVEMLDSNLAHFSGLIKRYLGKDIRDIPGAGAAGGMGGGLMAFCNARVVKGIEYILDLVDIDRKMAEADIVITGEGRIDGQTVYGKVPVGIARRAKAYNKPVFAICGYIGDGARQVYEHGIDAVMSAIVAPVTLEEAIRDSAINIEQASERLFRIIRASRGD